MPVTVKDEDVKWSETLDKIHITILFPDRYIKNVSISTSRQFLKVSSPPYIWECFLPYDIDPDDASIARIESGAVTFELVKKDKLKWGKIKHEKSDDKAFCQKQREEALLEIEKQINESSEKTSAEKHEKRREAVRKQMELEDLERKRIENAKLIEKQRLNQEIAKWHRDSLTIKSDGDKQLSAAASSVAKPNRKNCAPLPRNSGSINVTFTHRAFPTAARESQEQQEQQWLEKQILARKSLDFDPEDLTVEERNPAWLESKGDDLCRKQDYQAAVNAYNLAIRMNPDKYSVFSSRAFCHLQLQNLHKAIEDASRALELLSPPVPSNSRLRFKNHIYRGKAFYGLELFVESLTDLEVALKIDPSDAHVKEIAEKARRQL